MYRHAVIVIIILCQYVNAGNISNHRIKSIIEKSSLLKHKKGNRIPRRYLKPKSAVKQKEYKEKDALSRKAAEGMVSKEAPSIKPLHIKPKTEIIQIEPMTIEKYRALQKERATKKEIEKNAEMHIKKETTKPFAALPSLPPETFVEMKIRERFERKKNGIQETIVPKSKKSAIPSFF